MKRYGSIIGLTPEKILEYKNLHAAVWPEVLAMLQALEDNDHGTNQ